LGEDDNMAKNRPKIKNPVSNTEIIMATVLRRDVLFSA